MVTLTSTYEGGLRCRAEHGPSGTTLLTDAPTDNHGKGESFSPTDLVAAALGACMMTIMGIVAERHGIDLDEPPLGAEGGDAAAERAETHGGHEPPAAILAAPGDRGDSSG